MVRVVRTNALIPVHKLYYKPFYKATIVNLNAIIETRLCIPAFGCDQTKCAVSRNE